MNFLPDGVLILNVELALEFLVVDISGAGLVYVCLVYHLTFGLFICNLRRNWISVQKFIFQLVYYYFSFFFIFAYFF